MSDTFLNNRILYHTFSRVAIQEGQGVAAAVNKTGHTVTTNDVWADIDKLPKNTTYFGNANSAFDDLKIVYNGNSTEFSKYVKLYEKAVLSPVDGSGQDANKNQAWELLVDGKRVKNFVAPTDVFDANGQPCNGYTLQLFDKSGTQIPATDGNWAFDYVAGLVIFERGKTPQDMGWASTAANGDVTPIKITAWAYVGAYLKDNITGFTSDIAKISGTTIPAIEEDITTISGTTIPAINAKLASLTVAAAGNELFQGTIELQAAQADQVTGLLTPVEIPTFVTKDPVSGEETTASATIAGEINYVTENIGTAEEPVEKKVDSQVNITVEGEVIAVKQQVGTGSIEEIYPDMIYVKDSNTTTLTANYGLSGETEIPNISAETSWIITFRA